MKIFDKIKGLSTYAPVVCFLAIEIIAFTLFSLGDSFLLYSILGLVLIALLILLSFYQYKKENITTYLLFAFPILIYGVLIAIGGYAYTQVSTLFKVFTPIALVSFASIGYLLSGFSSFKIKYLMYTIYGVLSLVTILNLIMTLNQFGPFYAIRYANYFTYYNGSASRVALNGMAYGLIGFSYQQITIEYFSLFPSLLFTSAIALFYISPKKQTKEFIVYAFFTALAFFALLFSVSKMMLIADIITVLVISFVVLLSKINKLRNKIIYGILTILLPICVLLLIFFLLNANGVGWVKNITTSNSVINHIFNLNKYSENYNDILNGMFSSEKLFGFPPHEVLLPYRHYVYPSGNWFIDQFMYGGIFVVIFFLIIFIISMRHLYLYTKVSSDNKLEKVLVLSLILEYFGYTFINGSVLRMVNYADQLPLFLSGPFLVIIALLGYTYGKSSRKVKYE